MTHATHTSSLSYLGQQSALSPLATFAVHLAVVVTKWSERRRTRMQLKDLDDHLLWDIGIDRATARKEANRPYWKM